MRLLELFLNGQPVDLPATTKGLLKFSQARASLADVAARVGEFSFPFTLPATRRNAAVLGVDKLHPLGLNKFGFYTDYAYELRVEGEVFTGTARLTSLKNGYTLTLLGEGLSWALLLGESKLTDLQFAPIAYDGSQLESILASDCDSTDAQFPLVAFGNFFAPPTTRTLADGSTEEVPAPPAAVLDYPLSVDDYPPGVYYGNVLRQIFASIGWQLQSRELDSDFWRSVVLTCAGADVAAGWPWGTLLKASAAGTANGAASYDLSTGGGTASAGAGFGQQSSGELVFLPLAAPLVASPTRAFDAPTASYTAPRNGVYTFIWAAHLVSGQQTWQDRGAALTPGFYYDLFRPVGLGLVMRRGGQDYSEADGGLCSTPPGVTPAYAAGQARVLTPTRIDVPGGGRTDLAFGAYGGTVSVYLEAGDVLQLAAFARGILTGGNGTHYLARQQLTLTWDGVSLACTRYEDDNGVSKELLQPADFLPPLLCRDVVRDFLQRVNAFIVSDSSRKIATCLSRAELSAAGGPPIDLTPLVDLRQVEYLPAAGAGVGSFVFSPAENSDEPLPVASDVVRAPIGPGEGSQTVGSLFAPVAFRRVYFPNGLVPLLPTCSTKDVLAQNRSETQPDFASQPPRLVRYTGTDAACPVPFMQRTVPLAGAAWDGVLCWEGAGGAVGSYYQRTLATALRGHVGRVSCPISPSLYRALRPGRRVYLGGAGHTVAAIQNFDPADEAGLCSLDLEREVL